MITGRINSAVEAVLRLSVRGPNGERRRITAVVDTGYSGALTLPPKLIAELALPWFDNNSVILGDGSVSSCDVFIGAVMWDRRLVRILVDGAETMPLVGMELLQGYRLMMDVERRGQVTIKPLPGRRHR